MRFENYASQIHKIIANTLVNKIQNHKLKTATISEINVSPDRKNITVFINHKDQDKIVAELNHIKGVFRKQIAMQIQTKKTPHLNFESDVLPEQIAKIDKILKNVKTNQTAQKSVNTDNYKSDI